MKLKKKIILLLAGLFFSFNTYSQITITYDPSGNLEQKGIQTNGNTAEVQGPFQTCKEESVTLTASGGTGYQWSTGASTASIQLIAHSSQDYTVTITTSDGCENILVHPLAVSSASCCVKHPDFEALATLYNSTNGVNWTNNTNWNPTGLVSCDPCQDNWFGVSCTAGRVTAIELPNNNLSGTLLGAIGNLTSLNILNLKGNNIRNTIPSKLGDLVQLKELNLADNQFSGGIPATLGNLNQLEELNLNSNQLTDTIPVEISYLVSLKELTLDNNNLTGNLPVSLSNLIYLEKLFLNNNIFSDSIPIEYAVFCPNTIVDISQNPKLAEEDFVNFCTYNSGAWVQPCTHPDFKALVALHRATNGGDWVNSTNWDPSGRKRCNPCEENWYGITCTNGRVTSIALPTNNLIGFLPEELELLTALETLNLSQNQLNGSIPPELGNISQLKKLELGNNQLDGKIPSSLGNLNQLIVLDLKSNQLSENIPESLSRLLNLQQFYLNNNQLSGCIPNELATFCQTTIVDFSNNHGLDEQDFNDFCTLNSGTCIPSCVHPDIAPLLALYRATNGANWKNVAYWDTTEVISCDPCQDKWTGVGCTNGRVTSINLQSKRLTGYLPAEIEGLTELVYLNLGGNEIGGIIPSAVGKLVKLEELSLAANRFRGAIPPELGALEKLEELNLSFNKLTDALPSELGNLKNITRLYLNSNQLSGNLPPKLSKLNKLRSLKLYSNQLISCIPNEFSIFCRGETNILLSSNPGLEEQYFHNFCINYSGSCAPVCQHPDFEPLIAFYKATNGTNWSNNSNWDTTGQISCNPCEDNWFGITCVNDRVTTIDLTNNGLTGSISPEIEGLSKLSTLFLGNNQLTGSIPKEIGNLSTLTNLELFDNQLTDNIPSSIGNLSKLRHLDLTNNQITGYALSLGNLNQLISLKLGNNQIGRLYGLEFLNSLEVLYLNNNRLTGTIPINLLKLPKIRQLHLNNNQLSTSHQLIRYFMSAFFRYIPFKNKSVAELCTYF